MIIKCLDYPKKSVVNQNFYCISKNIMIEFKLGIHPAL